MARILFAVPPLIGHLNPALAAAEALTQRGHTVAWAAHPDKIGRHLSDAATVYPLATWPALDREAPEQTVRGLASITSVYEDYILPMATATFASMLAAADAFAPDVMVVDHQMLAGALAATQQRTPWVTFVTTSASILEMQPPMEDWLRDHLQRLQHQLLPDEPPIARPDLSPHRVVVFSVEALLDSRQPRLPANYRFVGPARGSGRQDVPFPWEWLRPDGPAILVTLGTRQRDANARFIDTIIDAVRNMDIQAIVVAPDTHAANAPDNVLVRPYVPQLPLLDRVAGVICHAGHNTVCEALARGVPLIVAPIRDDQPAIARQVVDAGAGISLRYGKVTVATARTAIERLLHDPLFRTNAARLAAEFKKTGGAESAADEIEAVAALVVRTGSGASAWTK